MVKLTRSEPIKAVLFDLDGTLIDTNELIIQSFQYALRELRPSLSRAEIIPQMGKTLVEQLNVLSGQSDVSELIKQYREYNVAHHHQLVRIFPGVTEVLSSLRQHGLRVGVVTTKMRASAMRSLTFFGLQNWVEVLVTVEDVENPKPHPEPIQKAISLLNCTPQQTLMVGDSQFDLVAAQQAGVGAIGVAWSLKGEDHLRQFPPLTIVQEMAELFDLVGITRPVR